MSIPTKEYLDEMETGVKEAMASVKSIVQTVSPEALHQPEADGKWSILQCLHHMSLASQLYVDNVSEKLQASPLPAAKPIYKGHWKGRMFARMNAPKPDGEIPMKVTTFKSMTPPDTLNADEVIAEFFQVHEALVAVINQSRKINIDKVKVATALGAMVKLRLGEAYRFILAHTQRHVAQLERIKNTLAAG